MGNFVCNTVVINPADEETSETAAVKEELSRIGVLVGDGDYKGIRQIGSYAKNGTKFITLQLGKCEFWAMEAGLALKRLASIPDSIDYKQFWDIIKYAKFEPAQIPSTANVTASN
jgi:hypothetical protein